MTDEHLIADVTTGDVIRVPLTPEEIALRDAVAAEHVREMADLAAGRPDFGTELPADVGAALPGLPAAVTTLRAYLVAPSPTPVQTAAALKLAVRIVLWLVRKQVRII